MIKVYYRGSCGSSRRAKEWFKKYGIEIQEYRISQLHHEDLLKLLTLSSDGIEEILKRPGKSSTLNNNLINDLMILSFSEALDFILFHKEILQTPIILDGKNYLIGYNEEEIRKFLPKTYRRHNL